MRKKRQVKNMSSALGPEWEHRGGGGRSSRLQSTVGAWLWLCEFERSVRYEPGVQERGQG